MDVPLQIYAPQKLWRTQVASNLYATSNIVNILDWGIKGDGVTDDAPAWQALLTAVPDGSIILVPDPTFVMALGSTITMTDSKGVIITSDLDPRNGAGHAPTFKWIGANHGTMLSMIRCQNCHISGFVWRIQTGLTVDTAINIDSTDGFGQISTQNAIQFCSFFFDTQTNSAAKVISIAATSTTNNENMDVWDCTIVLAPTSRPSAAGVGIFVGANANSKHHRFYRNIISNATIGIHTLSGSCEIQYLEGGSNETDLVLLGGSEPIYVGHIETEGSGRAIDFIPGQAELDLANCRLANAFQTNTGGFVKIDGAVTIRNCNFEDIPPVGGTCVEDRNTGQLRLTFFNNRFKTGTTYAETGLQSFIGITDARSLVAFNNDGANDFPGRFFLQLSGSMGLGSPQGSEFGTPILLNPLTYLQLLNLGATPVVGTIAHISNSTTQVWGAVVGNGGGGGNPVLAWFNGANWTVIGA